jgi:hypothetical protein
MQLAELNRFLQCPLLLPEPAPVLTVYYAPYL